MRPLSRATSFLLAAVLILAAAMPALAADVEEAVAPDASADNAPIAPVRDRKSVV